MGNKKGVVAKRQSQKRPKKIAKALSFGGFFGITEL
jgi:hypothetical protein